MRVLLQRVLKAEVTVDGAVKGTIRRGICLFLGVGPDDDISETEYVMDKVMRLRIFSDDEGRMNRSLEDTGGDILIVSQFTLYGDARKGCRPSFTGAAPHGMAEKLYEHAVAYAERRLDGLVQHGVFGADMKVTLVNDGPVTMMLYGKRG